MHDALRPASHADNATGILAMLASMAAFTANDAIVKLAGERLPLGEVIVMRNVSATFVVLAYAILTRSLSIPNALPKSAPLRLAATRTAAEMLSTICFLSGLLVLPFADATAIIQIMPITITAAAVLFLKERPRIELWLAMFAGLIGVMLIVRPGTDAFSPAALLILLAVGFMTLKEIVTRKIGTSISTLNLTLLSASSVIVSGLVLMPFETWLWPKPYEWAMLFAGGTCLAAAYAFAVLAMIHGAIAVVQPFRYAAIPFALVIGWLAWGQWPDAIQFAGIAVLVAASFYTLRHQKRIPAPGPPA